MQHLIVFKEYQHQKQN